jgi:hypothetical protein
MRWQDIEEPAAFDQYMRRVDADLRAKGIDEPSRPTLAALRVQADIGPFWMTSPIAKRIDAWFAERYGDRLNLDWKIGQMLVLVQGDPYAVEYPTIFGECRVNVFELIKSATPALVRSLSDKEQRGLGDVIVRGFGAFLVADRRITPRRQTDLGAAVLHAIGWPRDYGQSKWATQQWVEKLVNGFLEAKGIDAKAALVKRHGRASHKLVPRVELAETHGLPLVDRNLLQRVECAPDARYGSVQVTAVEAVEANQAAVLICGHIAEHWPSSRP